MRQMKIGGKLKSGKPHDGRAPDYDDWALNCDILFWHVPLGCALELSSMGIRVNAESLRRQLEEAGCPQRAELPFHKMLLDGTLPLTMGVYGYTAHRSLQRCAESSYVAETLRYVRYRGTVLCGVSRVHGGILRKSVNLVFRVVVCV